MEGFIAFLVAIILGAVAGAGAYAGWWAFIGVPAAAAGWAVGIGLIVFLLALCGVGILVVGDL